MAKFLFDCKRLLNGTQFEFENLCYLSWSFFSSFKIHQYSPQELQVCFFFCFVFSTPLHTNRGLHLKVSQHLVNS